MLLFIALQLADLITTLIGFRLGAEEASPFVRRLIAAFGPLVGVALAKTVACAIFAACLWAGKRRVLRWATSWFAALCVWNIAVICRAL
jgi:hypothetical protein